MWKLDERTIKAGRKGLANARAALKQAAKAKLTEELTHELRQEIQAELGAKAPLQESSLAA